METELYLNAIYMIEPIVWTDTKIYSSQSLSIKPPQYLGAEPLRQFC